MSAVLIISPEPWDANQVSKHHYARTLARRGHTVFFVDPPGSSGTTTSIAKAVEEDGEILLIRGPRVAPGLRFMPRILRRALERRWLEKLERNAEVHIDIVWLFENSRFYDMSFAGDRVKIYHQVDLNQDRHVAAAASSADISFAVSDIILDRITRYSRYAQKISHGVFAVGARTGVNCTKVRPGRRAAAYVGNLDIAYLDAKTLQEVVVGSQEVDFHFIGSYSGTGEAYRRLHGMKNVFFWGRLASRDLQEVLEKMDVLMIVYDTINHRDQLANPHKLMEYLAAGKVTVATFTEEYKSFAGDVIAMVEDPHDYVTKFRSVVANLDRWNSPELQAQRIAIANDNTYERQLDRISSALSGCPAIQDRFGNVNL